MKLFVNYACTMQQNFKKNLKKKKIFFLHNFKPNAHDYDDVDIKDIKVR